MEEIFVIHFIDSLKCGGYSLITLNSYKYHILKFSQWLKQKGRPSFFDLNTSLYAQFVRELNSSDYKTTTIYNQLKSVYAFYQWLCDEGILLVHPIPQKPKAHRWETIRKIPTRRTIKELYSILRKSSDLIDKRTLALLELGYSCGLRLGELHRLDIEDLDFFSGAIRVKGKGCKIRYVPLGVHTIEAIREYVFVVRPRFLKNTAESAFFLSLTYGKRLGIGGVMSTIKRLRGRYNLDDCFTTHSLRHRFATDLLIHGAAIQDVSKMLGHSTIGTTQIYTRLFPNDLKKSFLAYHSRG